MSSTYLYSDNDTTYDMSVSSTGTVLSYSDITTRVPLPSIQANANKYLKVRNDGQNLEWAEVEIGGGLELILDERTASNPPSVCFEDTSGTKYNTGINMYRDTSNANEETISFYADNTLKMKIAETSVNVETNLNVNGNSSATNFRAGNGTTANPSYSFTTSNGQDTGMFYNNTGGNNDEIRLSAHGAVSMVLQQPGGTSFTNTKLLINTGSTTNPGLIFNSTAVNTGFSGDVSNNLYTLTAGSINTTHTNNSFEVGRTNLNNTNTRILNQNGPSNFNTFTPTYTNIINTQITSGRTDGNYFNIDYNPTTGVYIAGTNGSGAGIVRIAVSGANNLTSWTTYNDTTFAFGNMRLVAYGPTPNIWVVGTGSSVTANFLYSTNTTTWTSVGSAAPFNTARAYSRLKWINGQFVGLTTASNVVFSSDGINWTLRQINATSYTLQDIVYSSELRMYVITTTSAAVLYFNDTAGTGITSTTTFTAQTTNVYASNAVAWSPKVSMFIIQNTSVATQWASSSDGINWRTYTTTALNANNGRLEWINDFGGLFVGCQAATNANCIVSRDGITWTQINLTISGQSRGFYYNYSQKVFVFGLDANLTFKNALTDFNNYIDSDAIYNTFNSNIRFSDVIEYQNQAITPVSGNNHFTVSQFNRPEVVFDTTNTNANIYLQGASFAGRVGTKFKFVKIATTTNNVRLHGFETCRLLTPLANVPSFNAQSSPLTYSILPAGVYGSFDLTRISDSGNGIWLVDNIMAMDANGTEVKISNLQTAGALFANGQVLTLRLTEGILEGTGATVTHTVTLDTPYNLSVRRNQGSSTDIKVVEFTDLGTSGLGFVFYMFGESNHNTNGWQIKNSSGQDLWFYDGAYTAVANTNSQTICSGGFNDFATYYCQYRTAGSQRRWIVRRMLS